jgi:hypothetical protein
MWKQRHQDATLFIFRDVFHFPDLHAKEQNAVPEAGQNAHSSAPFPTEDLAGSDRAVEPVEIRVVRLYRPHTSGWRVQFHHYVDLVNVGILVDIQPQELRCIGGQSEKPERGQGGQFRQHDAVLLHFRHKRPEVGRPDSLVLGLS